MASVDPRAPLRIVVASSTDGVELDALVGLGERAFRHNYAGKLRVVYDAEYYQRLLAGDDWLAVLALDEDGRLVGCMVSLLRMLSYRGALHPAAYSTNWAVDPAYRRTGVSLLIWQALAAEQRRRGLIGIGAAHGGHSGTQGGVVFRDPPESRRAPVLVANEAIWSRTLAEPFAASPGHAAGRLRRLCFVDGPDSYDDPDAPIDALGYQRLLDGSGALNFAPSHGFAQMYFNSEQASSGAFWVECGDNAACVVGYAMFSVALDEAQVGRIGRIQFFQPFGCDADRQAIALDAVCAYLQRTGCSSASVLDQRAIDHAALRRCGFVRTPEQVTLSLRVEQALVDSFQEPAYSALDFI